MKRPQRILVATDFSESAEHAFEAALRMAKRFGAELHLCHAVELPLPVFEPYAVSLPAGFIQEARGAAQQKLDALLARVKEAGLDGTACLGETPAPPAVAERARELGADLVVVGTRGLTGLKHVLLGSVAERTVHESPCSVLTVKGDGEALPPRRVAVGVDFSSPSAEAVDVAAELAREFEAELHLVHALDLRLPLVMPYEVSVPDAFVDAAREAAEAKLAHLVKELEDRGVATVRSHLVSASPAHSLNEAATQLDIDLVVTGSRGLTGLKHVVLGSVAERTLRGSPCSVLTVKHPEADA